MSLFPGQYRNIYHLPLVVDPFQIAFFDAIAVGAVEVLVVLLEDDKSRVAIDSDEPFVAGCLFSVRFKILGSVLFHHFAVFIARRFCNAPLSVDTRDT